MNIRGIGHRGYPAKYPENTMSSFQAAIELGYTHMELDVHLSKDGIPVVMHDNRIDRMTDGVGEIREFTLTELKQFTIDYHERIPTLEEVLLLAKDRIVVSIELKDPKLYKGIEEKVYEVIRKTGVEDQVYLISFNHKSLAKMRSISKDIEIGPLVSKFKRSHFRLIDKLDAKYVAVRYGELNESFIEKCEELDIQVVVWTVNTLEQMRYLQKYPSILITTDELEKYKAFNYPHLIDDLEQVYV
ncbi:glycerophosphodiester phosphodiesterase [Virgibacillus indicus]|uniref:Glycerophosphodiester phosphodiesterase n=1 Tax=Virgibacillus indicus TaxID=2024554 RepID=A0A265N8R1_9BACI|nr:glycerophosphodiester phosphodiesterase family protein [Virgibacillus indicus]OZU88383.1 glycerophosphodiester phosphodiesterase [Virgibacillus indicus]